MSRTSVPRPAPPPRERLADLGPYRSLAQSFLHRELRTRFLGSRFGWLWSLINPLMILATYSVVFGIVMGGDRGLAPSANGVRIFAVYLFTGLVCWNIFSSVLQRTIDGLLELMPLRKKVAFPLFAPLVGMAAATLVERSAEVALLTVVYALYGNIGWTLLLVPVLMILTAGLGFGLGLAVSVVNVRFRDVGHLVGVALQLVFYATPVIYPPSFVDTHLAQGSPARLLLEANPLYAFVQAFRDLMWSLALPTARTWLVAVAWTAIALVGGWLIFRDRAYLVAEGA